MPTNSEKIILSWSAPFPLRDAFVHQKPGGGIYMWGFKNRDVPVVWYVGKATTGKGVYPRLRKHYLDIMSGQYQIPVGFLNGSFTQDRCSNPGWRVEYGNPEITATLNDWSRMERIFRAGHRFANEAFARVALLNVSDSELKNVERQAIHSLRPVVNKQRSKPLSLANVSFQEAADDAGWMDSWLHHESTMHQSGASGV